MTSGGLSRVAYGLLSFLWRPYLFGGAVGLVFLIVQAAYGFPVPWLAALAAVFCLLIMVGVWRTSLTVEDDRLRICNGGRVLSVQPADIESIAVGPTWRSPGSLPTVFVNRRGAPPIEVQAARLAPSRRRDEVAADLIRWSRSHHVACSLPLKPGLFWGAFKPTA